MKAKLVTRKEAEIASDSVVISGTVGVVKALK
jgi:hypothetical protein